MRIVHGILSLCLVGTSTLLAQNSDPAKVAAYLKALPPVTPPVFTTEKKEMLASFAISCADHPQENPGSRNPYLWSYATMPQIIDGYDRNRAFFGCANWHDAVGSTWMLMSLLRQDPKITLGSDIKDIATTHFRKSNIDGELAFFTAPRAPGEAGIGFTFEQPYGYSWLLKLYGETKGGNFAEGRKMATALAPLARYLSQKYVFYLYNLKVPFRTGADNNTAWAMSLALDGVNLSEDTTLQTAIHNTALRLYSKDTECAGNLEPQNADHVSACLTEAALMSRVMEQKDYLKWLDAFLPPVYAKTFQGYAREINTSHTSTTGPDAQVQLAAKARLIGLSFQRAYDLLIISYALPKDDPRVAIFRNLASANANHGYDQIGTAGYEGQHWLATYALMYENAAKGPPPLAPEKPKGRSDRAADADAPPDGN